jgi:nucleoside-diphosphate-sugar epimerase
MRRVVVTGASGFIGQVAVRQLLRDGLDGAPVRVVAITRDPSKLPADVRDRVESHALDLATASTDAIGAACGDRAIVLHLAANASVRSGEAGFANNVRSVERLITALKMRAPERVVYASSIGAVDRQPSDDCSSPLDESTPPHPLTRYGASKLEGERLLAASGLPFAIVRPTWVYGPGMREDSHLRVFLAMVRRGALASRIRFPGRVSVIHVDDLVRALLLAATHPGAAGGTYFATDGAPIAIGDLFGEMAAITGRAAPSIGIPGVVAGLARSVRRILPFAAQNLNSDVLLANDARLVALGFRAQVALRTGLIELARATHPAPAAPAARWLVTGAASGIGRALTHQLHASGAQLIAVDRDAAGLAALAQDCPGIETAVADLSDAAARATVRERIEGAPSLDGVVNCAGIGARGTVASIAVKAQRPLLEVNVAALAEFSTLALRRFVQQPGGGTLVNVASSAALQPLPYMAAYAASKAFVLSYSEAAAEEVADTSSVRVITVCPGGTDTGFQQAAGVKRVDGERLMPASAVATLITQAIARRRSATLLVGGRTKGMALAARVLPRTMLVRLWGKLMGALR